jgi:hypothetical protein
MGRQPVAIDQLSARNALADCVGQTLINGAIIVRQFQIIEHALRRPECHTL